MTSSRPRHLLLAGPRFCPAVSEPFLPRRPSGHEEAPRLSEREEEVARLVGTGATNREVARALFITEGTAKNHVTSILRKLGLRDRTRLALWVRERRDG